MQTFAPDFTGIGVSEAFKTVPGQRYVFIFNCDGGTGTLTPQEKFADFTAVFPFYLQAGDTTPLVFDLTAKNGRMLFMAAADRFQFAVAGAIGAQVQYSIARVPL